jgi:NAD(P)-dependent dehydrogenase (short-subunit alcohol dehydrogenase family)
MHTLITGATSGIGKATALLLAQQPGHTVFAGAEREEYVDALRDAPDRVIPIVLDVTVPASIERAVAAVTERVPEGERISLVNNAGIAVFGPLECVPVEDLARQFEVSLFGVVAVTQAVLPLMRKSEGGRIINMGSLCGRWAIPIVGPYSAAKSALRSISDSMRVELAPWNIHVALIEGGATHTPLMGRATEKMGDVLAGGLPQRCYGAVYDRMKRVVGLTYRLASPPETAKRPRPYYRVGKGVWPAVLLESFVPARARDWLIRRLYRVDR